MAKLTDLETVKKNKASELANHAIFCIDYSYYAMGVTKFLFPYVENMSSIIRDLLIKFELKKMPTEDSYIFGYSFGAYLFTLAVAQFEENKLKKIGMLHCEYCVALAKPREINWARFLILFSAHLVCEPYKPELQPKFFKTPIDVAAHSQCIHTSSYRTLHPNGLQMITNPDTTREYGDTERDCHQNWVVGRCGIVQDFDKTIFKSKTNHSICPYVYNASFANDMVAVGKRAICDINSADVIEGFKMGYNGLNHLQKYASICF